MPALTNILLVDDASTTNFPNQSLVKHLGLVQHLHTVANEAEALQFLHQACVPPNVPVLFCWT